MKHNYLLLIPSLMRNGAGEILYAAPTGKTFHGRQTNIAATKHILDTLASQGEKLDKILMVCSDQVLHQPIVTAEGTNPVTSLDYYKNSISDFARDLGYSEEQIQTLFIPYAQEQINPGDFSAMEKIQSQILCQIDPSQENGLFLDYTGGQRDASMLLVFFARLLEHRGARVRDVLYSKIDQGGSTGHIESCMDTYRLFYRLDEITSGDLSHLQETAREMGDSALAEGIQKTIEAVRKNKAGNYEAAEEEAEKEEVSTKGGVLNQIMAQTANQQRQQLLMENSLTEKINSGNLQSASHMIRESGIRMLVRKGVVLCPQWMKKDNFKNLGREFYPYAYYYGTYLNFVQHLLRKLQCCKSTEALWGQYQQYWENHLLLVPSSHPSSGISSFLVREFNQQQPHIKEKLEKSLMAQVQASEVTVENLTSAVAEYETQRNKYLTSYMQSGFPFGNIDGKYSHTFFSVTEQVEENGHLYERTFRKSYPEEYRKLLDASIRHLLSDPEVFQKIQALMEDRSLLARSFPPICSEGLFLPADGDLESFAVRVDILDQVRKNRNTMTHAGEKVNDTFIDTAGARIMNFAQWLDSL